MQRYCGGISPDEKDAGTAHWERETRLPTNLRFAGYGMLDQLLQHANLVGLISSYSAGPPYRPHGTAYGE